MEHQIHDVYGPTDTQNEQRLRLLIETGLLLASGRSLDVVIQGALDAGLSLCGASYGAFFYNNSGDSPGKYHLFKISGKPSGDFADLPLPRPLEDSHLDFLKRGVLRSNDITLDPRYRRDGSVAALPLSDTCVRSYLALPVRSPGGAVLGGMFYGHPDTGVFNASCEDLVSTIASQAAVAIDNIRLSESLTHEIASVEAARSLQRETSDRLRQALDAAQLGTWTWDRSTDLLDLDVRAAHLLHIQPHANVTRTELREGIVAKEDKTRTWESLRRALDSSGLYSAEYRVKSPDGLYTWVSATGIATFAPGSSEITGMIGTVQDITTRKTQEDALRQTEKLAATGRLAATIAHEINNPLEAVTNLIYLSRTDPSVPEHVQHLLETADSELARVAQIAQQTLGFYRDTTKPIEISLDQLLQSVVNLFERKMLSNKIHCTLDLDPDLRMHGLQGEIRQVFSNLIVNAIDAMAIGSKAGRIHIRGRHRGGRNPGLSVLVCDEGTGIPAPVRERIFSPFFTTKESVGTGLGLWVTRGFVEKQGGTIRFRSRIGNRAGTIFRVFLPTDDPKVR